MAPPGLARVVLVVFLVVFDYCPAGQLANNPPYIRARGRRFRSCTRAHPCQSRRRVRRRFSPCYVGCAWASWRPGLQPWIGHNIGLHRIASTTQHPTRIGTRRAWHGREVEYVTQRARAGGGGHGAGTQARAGQIQAQAKNTAVTVRVEPEHGVIAQHGRDHTGQLLRVRHVQELVRA